MSSREADIAGKTVVVTGATSGLGRGTALRLSELGARVVVAARRGDVLDELVAEIVAHGGDAVAVAADVSSITDVRVIAETAIERFGGFDVWVNNVGIGALGFFWDVPMEDHSRVIDVNVTGLMNGAHVALRHFLDRGAGVLVNIGSVESEVPLAYQSSYAASKAAVLSLSRSLNEELRLAGHSDTIKVGTVMPWAIDTPWWDHAANYTGRTARMAAMDDPAEVVDAIVEACVNPRERQPVGWKARGADVSHRLAPDLTKRVSAKIIDAESAKGDPAPETTGSIYTSTRVGTTVDGGTRERMKREDASPATDADPAGC
ncbi:MAG: SDR family NAD(P)-dependent oxidoreductase [Microbacterium sp.]|uniref:SDR family NAD(P)-dependent oxidoreductase n=1 Tax=Microbacterium sp. TaxID=51671 RepID=UPI0027158086|nr:SDR family NAD(P)-dependent oxidoreductase [Microbacterium sp.]MDO8384729.1 SDR family NAD(P)-dependent oxidoreductase [Microbacterium sp.]